MCGDTYVDIFSQKFVRNLVLLENIVVDTCSCKSASQEKAE
jgi:hypothetical protein